MKRLRHLLTLEFPIPVWWLLIAAYFMTKAVVIDLVDLLS
jgi:hypothetical protein